MALVAGEARVARDRVAERVLPDLVVGDGLLALVLLSAMEDILDLVDDAALVCECVMTMSEGARSQLGGREGQTYSRGSAGRVLPCRRASARAAQGDED